MIVCACSHLIKLDWQCIRYKADYITILYDSLSVYWDRARADGRFGVQHTKMIEMRMTHTRKIRACLR